MLSIKYGHNISFNFPRYYSNDASWYMLAESSTKQFFIDVIKPNFNIIDAGAQIGMYTVLFSKLATEGTVHAFEPTDTVNLLSDNLAYNNCKNVKIHNIALSDKDGVYNFTKKNNIKFDLIKIDVDSYDFEVLQGSKEVLLSQEPIIMVELNHALGKRGYEPRHAIDFMKSIGYSVKQVYDGENYFFTKDKA